MTAREFLGDDNIRKLEGLGFSPLAIRDLAKKEYETKKQSLIDRGINEGVAAQGAYENMSDHEIEQMNDDANRGWIRRGWDDTKKAVLETANAYSKFNDYGKDVENYLNKKISGDEKAKFERKTKSSLSEYADKEIKRIDKADERWAQAHPDEWNVAGFAGGLVGGFIDPINLIPLAGSAKWGKKVLYYAGTGAAAGGVSAYGGDRNVGEGVVTGAVGGAILGPLMEYGVSGISKLITKRRASRAANEADAASEAENSEFLRATDELGGSEIKAAGGKQAKVANGQDGGIPPGGGAGGVKTAQTDDIAQTMTAREFATGEVGLDEATAAKVVKEAAQGKEKSDFVDADTYADIVKLKNFENQRDYARAYGEQIEAAKQSLESAREQSAVRYADTQRAINGYQKQGMSASATRELINAKFKPSADEINYTRAYNGGADVDPRLAGQGIFYALEKDIAAQAYTPEIYAARLKQRGFSDESAQAFTQAYIQKDINIAKDWANGKAAEVYESNVRAQVAAEIKAKNEIEGEGWTMKDGGEAKTDYVIKTDLAPNVRDLSKITTDEISADLEYLSGKHPEIFDKPSDVFRLVKDIKENPTHFFTNNRLDYALIVKRLKNNKIGKLAIDKQSGEVKHATKVKDKDLKRLAKVSEEKSGNAGIIQTFTRPGSKLENQGLGYQDEAIISQKGNLVNEETKANGLRDSVSSVGDNASRTGGRQASDEQILRQGRRDTANASQTKRAAQSDEQVEQQWAAKADGEADAAATGEQVVEKQGSSANIGGRLAANSNAHLGSGLVAGSLNSIDEDGNFGPERFAVGFLAGLAGGKAVATGLRKMTPKLYNKILGAAEKMPQMANGNPRLLGKLYSNGKDVSLNSFAGEKAITANVGKLDQAKAMLEKGADEVEIWQKTGWFKDKDGAWKFEIGDSNARLNPGFQSGGRLGELLDHEELFKAYPELKDVRVVKIGDETPKGAALSVKDAAQREKRGIYNVAFNNKKSTIIRKDLDAIDEIIKFEKGEADYMLHGERKSGYGALHIQKHLDTQNNGWVTKQEYLDMGQMLRKSTMKEADDKRIYTYFNDEGVRFRVVIGIGKNKERVISFYSNRKPLKAGLSYNSQNYDGNLPLNDDIIAQNGTKGYYSPAKNEIGLSDLGDRSTLMHEVQHAIQEIEDFARGGDFNTVWNAAAKNIEKKYESELARLEKISNDAWGKHAPLQKEYIKLFDGGLKDTPEAQRLLKQMRAFSDEGYRADHEIRELRKAANAEQNAITEETLQENYRKIHGEVEARNVQNRLNLDGKAHPHETFDVNPNETIVSKEDGISYSRKIEEIKREHPNVERELDESIAAMRKESFNDSNFKAGLMGKFDTKEITTQELGKSVNLSDKQLAVLKNDIKNADFKVISDSKIYFDKIGKDGDKKRFFVDIAQNGSLRVDAYAKSQVDNIPVKQSALEELAGTGDAARLKNMSFEVKAAYRNELDPIKKEAILKTAELNKLKKAAQSGDKAAAAKFEEFKAKNLDENGNIKDGLSLC